MDKRHFLKDGQYVRYNREIGRMRGEPNMSRESVFVVYNCAGQWEKFRDYTGAPTKVHDLKLGWITDKEELRIIKIKEALDDLVIKIARLRNEMRVLDDEYTQVQKGPAITALGFIEDQLDATVGMFKFIVP